ncbi:MAG TPA: Gfo/Idh/MocA family oxidoreductase [Acidobacteriota bacterium]|nr:Gfo/Idh/MocA family oxidoreductase [Acidobacteriota bacterium]
MKKIAVGFAGAGWMGKALLSRVVERDDAEVLALCERNPERASATLAEFGLPANRYEPDFRQMAERDDIDAVFVCTPNAFHGPQSIIALEAGKHLFCEKPCATSFEDFTRQIELERRNRSQITMVDYILHFDSMERRLAGMIAEGTFGKVTKIQVNYRHPVNIEGEKAWKLKADIMGDAIGMGINHAVSVLVSAMASQAKPVEVFASSMPAQVRPFEPDPIWSIQIRFDNGAVGFCFGNIDSANGYDAYHNVSGTKGAFIFDSLLDRPQKVRYWSEAETGGKWVYPLDRERCRREGLSEVAWPEDTSTPDSGDVIHHQTELCVDHFLTCIQKGEQSPLSFVRSAIVAEIGWAAQMSSSLRRPIELPLDYEYARSHFANEG